LNRAATDMADPKGTILSRNEGLFARGLVGDLRIKIGGADSDGALSVVEYEVLPARRTVAHYHLKIYESVFISEGELRVRVGDDWSMQRAGATILLPIGVIHAWENASSAPARMLIISAPAVDGYFKEMAKLVASAPGGKPSLEELRELNRRYDFVLVED
jgi:quercetin dioxygenase-like cupin family protein